MNPAKSTVRLLIGLFTAVVLFLLPLGAAELYRADFEQESDIRFVCVEKTLDNRTIYDLKEAETLGMVKLYRSERSKFLENNRSGVFSHIIDVSVDKTEPQSGGLCMFAGGKLDIPITNDLFFTGYLLPIDVPPDIHFLMGILFSFEDSKTGKQLNGSLLIYPQGTTPDGWYAFRKNIRELVSGFRNPVLTGWMVQVRSDRAFHGQRVRFALDDISFDTDPAPISADKEGQVKLRAIRADDPYVVDYRSLHDEAPADRVNLVRNGGFELGLTGFYPYVQRDPEKESAPALPDPDATFQIAADPKAPQGDRVFRVSRPDGSNTVSLRTDPVPIVENGDYVLSFFADTDRPCELAVAGRQVSLTTGWKRYRVELPGLKSYTAPWGQRFPGRMELLFRQTGDANFALDAVQLQKAPLTDYAPAGIVELAAAPEARYGLVGEGNPLRWRVEAYNDSGRAAEATVEYEAQDAYKRRISGGSRALKLEPGKRGEFTVEAPAGRNYARLACRLKAAGQPEQSFVTSAAAIPDLSGISGNEFFGSCAIEGDNPPDLKRTLELNRLLGMYFNVVYGLNLDGNPNWKQSAGARWKQIDAILDFHDRAGMKAVLQDELVNPHTKPAAPTPELEAMLRGYCRAKAEHTCGRVLAHNVFGEYMKFPLEERLPLMESVIRAARAGFREGDPEAKLWGVGQDHMDTILTTYGELGKRGAFGDLDAASIHQYNFGRAAVWQDTMRKLIELVRRDDPARMLTGTEGGVAAADTLYWDDIAGESGVYTHVVTELEQAQYVIAMNLMMFGSGAFPHVASFYPYEGAMQFRRYYHFVNAANGLSPRPVFPAYAQMVRRLAGATVAGEIEQRKENGLQGYLFHRNGRSFAAFWRYSDRHEAVRVRIPLGAKELEAFDLVGERIPLAGERETVLELDPSPVWLYPAPGCSDARFGAAVRAVRVLQPRVTVRPGTDTAAVEVANDTEAPLSGTLDAPALGLHEKIRLAPAAKRSFPAKELHFSASGEPVAATVETEAGTFAADPVRMIAVPRAAKAPVIDGDLSEFSAAPFYLPDPKKTHTLCLREGTGAVWNGDADLSGRLALLWDDRFLYIGAEVRDDKACSPHADPALYWANDALHLSLAMSGDLTDPSLRNLIELAFCRHGVSSVLSGSDPVDLSGVRMAAVRRGDRTCYEAAIPWAMFKSGFVPGRSPAPGFNFSFSDNDGITIPGAPAELKGYQKALQFNSGIADRKSSADDAYLIFTNHQSKGD